MIKGKMTQAGKWLVCLAGSYIITFLLLLGLAFILYKYRTGNRMLQAGVLGICFLATMAGGYALCGKGSTKRYLQGLLFGGIYFLVLCVVSIFVPTQEVGSSGNLLLSLVLCAAGGMIGGMVHSLFK